MACPNKYQKSSLRAYNTTEQSITSGNNISFSNIGYESGISISISAPSDKIYLKKSGLYLVTLDADITDTTANTDVTVQMLVNGNAVPGAMAEVSIATIGSYVPGTITALVPIGCTCSCISPTSVSFQVIGTTAVIANANVNAIKLA